MLRTLLLSLLLAASPALSQALAQDPAAPATPAGPVTPGERASGSTTETPAWTLAPVELKRFPDADVITASLPAGTEVRLVVAEGDLYRVRRGTDFGWVAADRISLIPPAGGLIPGTQAPVQEAPPVEEAPAPTGP